MEDIVNRLESANEFCESMEARQLRKDAAEEIRQLRQLISDIQQWPEEFGFQRSEWS